MKKNFTQISTFHFFTPVSAFVVSLFVACLAFSADTAIKNTSNCSDSKNLLDMECTVNGLSKPTKLGGVNDMTLPTTVEQNCFIKPCFQEGDFDGDGKQDKAILVIAKASHKKGIAILFANGKKVVIGAGNSFDLGGDDFVWLDAWSVIPKKTSSKSDVLSLGKTEPMAALVSWQGKRFKWSKRSF